MKNVRNVTKVKNVKNVGVILACLVIAGCASASPGGQSPVPRRYTADLRDANNRTLGMVELTEDGERTRVRVRVSGIAPGEHGVHFHAEPRCEGPAFASSGGHYNPLGRHHGLNSTDGPHAGDLPNIMIGADSTGTLEYTTELISLRAESERAFDAARGSMILHAGRDDQVTDPSGNSGARIACALFGAGASGRRNND